MPGNLCTAPRIISLSPYVTDTTLAKSGLWLETRTGAGGTATITENFFGRSPWLHGQQVCRIPGNLIASHHFHSILSLIPSFSLPDVLCDPTDLIWKKGTSFEAMTGRTAPSSDGLLAEVFWGFPRL